MEEMKRCGGKRGRKSCGLIKPLSDFGINVRNRDGLQSWCCACELDRVNKWVAKNKERSREYKRRWAGQNKTRVKHLHREWRERNPERLAGYRRIWVLDNAEKIHKKARLIKSRYNVLRQGARKRGISVSLSLVEYGAIVSLARCHYCDGVLPEVGHALDRMNNDLGYCLANVVPCCTRCNEMKGCHLMYAEMKEIWRLRKLNGGNPVTNIEFTNSRPVDPTHGEGYTGAASSLFCGPQHDAGAHSAGKGEVFIQ